MVQLHLACLGHIHTNRLEPRVRMAITAPTVQAQIPIPVCRDGARHPLTPEGIIFCATTVPRNPPPSYQLRRTPFSLSVEHLSSYFPSDWEVERDPSLARSFLG